MNTKRNWPENLSNSRLLNRKSFNVAPLVSMTGGELLYLPHWVRLQKQELAKHYALVRQNRPLAIRSFLSGAPARIVVIAGHEHPEMGRRSSILENEDAGTGIAELLSRDSRIFYGHPGGTIDAFVSTGSALSNQLARALDGHAETLERTRKPAFGSLVSEFDPLNKTIVSYIEDQPVIEPFRELVNESNRKQIPVFKPELDKGILRNDVLVIKVLRSRSGDPSIVRIEGLGPAATVYGFRLLLENKSILLKLAKYAAKWDSFEAVIVVKNVEVKKDRRGRKSMAAAGPLDIIGCWPIDGTEVDVDVLMAAYESLPRFVPERSKILCFPAVRKVQVALHPEDNYNPVDKNAAAALPLLRKDYVGRKEFVPSQQLRKLRSEFKEKTRGLSDEKRNEVLELVFSVVPDIIESQLVEGMTSEEVKQKIQGLVKKEGVVFESQPKPRQPLAPPDLSEIPLWQGRKKHGMPLDFVKTHYGQWLSAFGAEEDGVFQDQIRARDPKLMQGLVSQLHQEGRRRGQLQQEGRRRTVADFVRPRAARTERELEQFDLDMLKRARRAHDLLRRRRPKEG